MRANTTHDIWDATHRLMSRVSYEKDKINKELSIDEKELREWFRYILKISKSIYHYMVNCWPLHWFICGIQIMIVLFAAISLSASAAVNLSAYGLQGLMYNASIVGIWLMSTISCAQTMFENMYFGMKGIGYLRFQRLRMIEVKLFRSPFMPDAMCANRDPLYDKTTPVIEYLNYYAYEKSAQKAISDAVVNNRWIDDHLLTYEQMPIELRSHMILMMVARVSGGDVSVNQKSLSRGFITQYADLIKKVDGNENYDKDIAVDDPFVIDLYNSASSPHGNITVTENNEEICSQEYYIKLITRTKLARIAYFARAHIGALTDTLEREKNPAWIRLDKKSQEQKKLQAFRWTLVRYLRRQSQKVSDAITANHALMKYFVPIFTASSALIPGGFSMLSSSPVLMFVKYTGKSWETVVCVWFWICGAINFMTSTRNDIRKVCAKICRYLNRHVFYQAPPIEKISNDSWWPRVTTVLQVLCAASMTVAASIFMVLNIKKLLSAPGDVGAHYVLNLLFNHVAPWLEPIFIPLCYLLSALSAFLTYNYTTKYYSSERIPRPKVGLDNQTALNARLSYLLRHNFDLTRHPVGKVLKIIASIVAVSQSIVFIVSAAHVMGPWLLVLMMPSVFAICLARNRKDIESAFDLYNQWQHPLVIDIAKQYKSWFKPPSTGLASWVVKSPRTEIGAQTDSLVRVSKGPEHGSTLRPVVPAERGSTDAMIAGHSGNDAVTASKTVKGDSVSLFDSRTIRDDTQDYEPELVKVNTSHPGNNHSDQQNGLVLDINGASAACHEAQSDTESTGSAEAETADCNPAQSDDGQSCVSLDDIKTLFETPIRAGWTSYTPHTANTDSPFTDSSRSTPGKPLHKSMKGTAENEETDHEVDCRAMDQLSMRKSHHTGKVNLVNMPPPVTSALTEKISD